MQRDILESDEAFRAQFDPSSESFHKGDTTPVPVGINLEMNFICY